MFRRTIAILFVIVWVGASVYDLVEEFDLSTQARVKNAWKAGFPSLERFIRPAADKLEHANRAPASHAGSNHLTASHPGATQLSGGVHNPCKDSLRIYKLNCVFLM